MRRQPLLLAAAAVALVGTALLIWWRVGGSPSPAHAAPAAPPAAPALSVTQVADALGIEAYDPCPCFTTDFMKTAQVRAAAPSSAWERLRAALECASGRASSECATEVSKDTEGMLQYQSAYAVYRRVVDAPRPSPLPEALHAKAQAALEAAGEATANDVSPVRPPGAWAATRLRSSLAALETLRRASAARQRLWQAGAAPSSSALLRRWEVLEAALLGAIASSSGASSVVSVQQAVLGSVAAKPLVEADVKPSLPVTPRPPQCLPPAHAALPLFHQLVQYKHKREWTSFLAPACLHGGVTAVVEPAWALPASSVGSDTQPVFDTLSAALQQAFSDGPIVVLPIVKPLGNAGPVAGGGGGRLAQERAASLSFLAAVCSAAAAQRLPLDGACAAAAAAANATATAAAAAAAGGVVLDALAAAAGGGTGGGPAPVILIVAAHAATRPQLQALLASYAASNRRLVLLLGVSDGSLLGTAFFDPFTSSCGSPVVSPATAQSKVWDASVPDDATTKGRALPHCWAAAARLHAVAAAAASAHSGGAGAGGSSGSALPPPDALPPSLRACGAAPAATAEADTDTPSFVRCNGVWQSGSNATSTAAPPLQLTVLQPSGGLLPPHAALTALQAAAAGVKGLPQQKSSTPSWLHPSAMQATRFCAQSDVGCLQALLRAWRTCAREAPHAAAACWGAIAALASEVTQDATTGASGLPLLRAATVPLPPLLAAFLSTRLRRALALPPSLPLPPPVLQELEPHHRTVFAALSVFPPDTPVPVYLVPALLHRTGARQRLCVQHHPSCLGATLQRLVAAQLVTHVLDEGVRGEAGRRATQSVSLSPQQHAVAVTVRGQLTGALRSPGATPVLLSNLHSYLLGDASVVVAAVRDSSVGLLVRLLQTSCEVVDALAGATTDVTTHRELGRGECGRLLDGLGHGTPLRLVQAAPNVPPLMLGTAAAVLLHVATAFAGALEASGYADASDRLQAALRGLHSDLLTADVAALAPGSEAWEAAKRDLNALLAVGHLHLASLGLSKGWMTADAVFGEAQQVNDDASSATAALASLPDYGLLSDRLLHTLSSPSFLPATFLESSTGVGLAPRASTSSRLLAFSLRSVFDEWRWQLLLLPHLRRLRSPPLLSRWLQQTTRLRATLETAHRLATGCPIGPQPQLLRGLSLPSEAAASLSRLPGWYEPDEPGVSALPLLFSLQQDAAQLEAALETLASEEGVVLAPAADEATTVAAAPQKLQRAGGKAKKAQRAASAASPAAAGAGEERNSSRAAAGAARVAAAVASCSSPLSTRLAACSGGGGSGLSQQHASSGAGAGATALDPVTPVPAPASEGTSTTLQSCIAAALHADLTCTLLAVSAPLTLCHPASAAAARACSCVPTNATGGARLAAQRLWPTVPLPAALPVEVHPEASTAWDDGVPACREGIALVAAAGAASWGSSGSRPTGR